MSRMLAITSALGLSAYSPVAAQGVDAALQVAEAAVQGVLVEAVLDDDHAHPSATGRSVTIDLEAFPANRRAALADRVSLPSSRKSDIFRCASARASTCTLVGTDFLLVLRDIRIIGQEAVVEFELSGASANARQPVWMKGVVVTLERGRDGWTVVDVETTWQT